jgi:hypothetical protein
MEAADIANWTRAKAWKFRKQMEKTLDCGHAKPRTVPAAAQPTLASMFGVCCFWQYIYMLCHGILSALLIDKFGLS